jgi:monovalent cation:H+ antiporter, CPA1 family
MVARAIVMATVEQVLARTPERLPARWSVVLFWGGLRGSLSMVLALSLPESFEHRALLIDLTFGVVLVSILVQGLTMSPLLRWAGAIRGGEASQEYGKLRARLKATREALHALDASLADREIHEATYEQLKASLSGREASLETALGELEPSEDVFADEVARTSERLLEAEQRAIQGAHEQGMIDDATTPALLEEITARSLALEKAGAEEPAPRGRDPEGDDEDDEGEAEASRDSTS